MARSKKQVIGEAIIAELNRQHEGSGAELVFNEETYRVKGILDIDALAGAIARKVKP